MAAPLLCKYHMRYVFNIVDSLNGSYKGWKIIQLSENESYRFADGRLFEVASIQRNGLYRTIIYDKTGFWIEVEDDAIELF